MEENKLKTHTTFILLKIKELRVSIQNIPTSLATPERALRQKGNKGYEKGLEANTAKGVRFSQIDVLQGWHSFCNFATIKATVSSQAPNGQEMRYFLNQKQITKQNKSSREWKP